MRSQAIVHLPNRSRDRPQLSRIGISQQSGQRINLRKVILPYHTHPPKIGPALASQLTPGLYAVGVSINDLRQEG